VALNNLTTQELLKRAEDMMREDQEFLKDFNAAINQLQKRQAEFQAEHPDYGDRYSLSPRIQVRSRNKRKAANVACSHVDISGLLEPIMLTLRISPSEIGDGLLRERHRGQTDQGTFC
jgi:hypothetical protein